MAITNLSAAVAAGRAQLDSGRLDLASHLFGQVLEVDPTHPDALSGMATVLMHLDQVPAAVDLLRLGLAAHPGHPEMRANRGTLYLLMQDYDGALRSFDALLAEQPGNAALLANRGNALMALDRHAEALDSFTQAAAAAPDYGGAHLNMGLLRLRLDPRDRDGLAAADLQRALDIDPTLNGAWTNLFVLRTIAGDREGAREAAEQALLRAPDRPEHHLNLARSLVAVDRVAEARKLLEKLRTAFPDFGPAELLLAEIAVVQARPGAAIAHLHRATELRPQDPGMWANLAGLLHGEGQVEQADAALDRALTLAPAHTAARILKGSIQLSGGRLAQGLTNLAAIYDLPEVAQAAPFARLQGSEPPWDGNPLGPDRDAGGHLVLVAEPDDSLTYLMLRFVAAARSRVARITFLDFRGMAPLLAGVPGIDTVVTVDAETELPCDAIQRVGALPELMPELLTAPAAAVPYLTPPPAAAGAWSARVAALAEAGGGINLPTVGLIWRPQGQDRPGDARALPLQQLAPLLQVPDVHFVSLQYGPAEAEIGRLDAPGRLTPLGQHIHGPADLAAALAAVDLPILVDSPAADLAGAMGSRAWLLLPQVAEWRWAERDGACLWYPSVTPFRQARAGDWDKVVALVAQALRTVTGG